MSQARTAGQVFRVRRLQRQLYADVDTLPKSQQSQLSDVLVRSGPDVRKSLRRTSQNALSKLAALDVDPAVRAQLAPNSARRNGSNSLRSSTATALRFRMRPDSKLRVFAMRSTAPTTAPVRFRQISARRCGKSTLRFMVTSSAPRRARLPVPQVGYLPVYDTVRSLVVNIPLSRSNRRTDGCATQPLLLSSP